MDPFEDSVTFSQNDFTPEAFVVFEDMRGKEELVDFVIHFESRSFTCHRLVLAARIPFFRTVFCTSQQEVALNETDPDAFESVINFAYTGKINITSGNAFALLSASRVLQLTQVYQACWKFLERRLHCANVLEIRRLAQDHDCLKYQEVADQYIRENFEEFSCSESFLALPFQSVKEMISKYGIPVSTKPKVFEAVIRWVNGSLSERAEHLPELLSAAHMFNVTPNNQIAQMPTEELVQSSLPCRNQSKETSLYPLLDKKSETTTGSLSLPEVNDVEHNSVSGMDKNNLFAICCDVRMMTVKQFDPKNETWSELSNHPSEVDRVAELNGNIYGFAEWHTLRFDVGKRTWEKIKNPRRQNVLGSGIVSHGEKIYFIGGTEGVSDNVRCFDPAQNEWVDVDEMLRDLLGPGVASVGEFIYITGGKSGSGVCDSVERYNPETKERTRASLMLFERYCHGCSSMNGLIYVSGGWGYSERPQCSVEVYDPYTDRWNIISCANLPGGRTSSVMRDCKLFVAYKSTSLTSVRDDDVSMKIYDPNKDKWSSPLAVPGTSAYLWVFLVTSEIL